MHASFRISEEVGNRVHKLASQHNIKPSQMYRILLIRGLDAESTLSIKFLIESLCLLRRLSDSVDPTLLDQAQKDADIILDELGITFNREDLTE